MSSSVIAAFAAVLIVSAGPAFAETAEAFVGAHGATTPATYAGGHAGADWRLDLWPDQSFHLLRTPDVGGDPLANAGRWHAEGGAIMLHLGAERLELAVRNAERLRPPGAPEDASGDLVTDGALNPAPITLPVAGMLTYLADAAIFEHCATGRRYPVAPEGDWLATERAYLANRPAPGEPLFVAFEATIAMREPMEGPARPMAVVDRFDAAWPGENCARAATNPALEETVWRIRSIGGVPVDWAPPGNEPHLLLHRGEGRFNASVGCNSMRGGYAADGGSLSFSAAASTMMACSDDLAAVEAELTAALSATAAQTIGGRTLRLFDQTGAVVAELEAVYLP